MVELSACRQFSQENFGARGSLLHFFLSSPLSDSFKVLSAYLAEQLSVRVELLNSPEVLYRAWERTLTSIREDRHVHPFVSLDLMTLPGLDGVPKDLLACAEELHKEGGVLTQQHGALENLLFNKVAVLGNASFDALWNWLGRVYVLEQRLIDLAVMDYFVVERHDLPVVSDAELKSENHDVEVAKKHLTPRVLQHQSAVSAFVALLYAEWPDYYNAQGLFEAIISRTEDLFLPLLAHISLEHRFFLIKHLEYIHAECLLSLAAFTEGCPTEQLVALLLAHTTGLKSRYGVGGQLGKNSALDRIFFKNADVRARMTDQDWLAILKNTGYYCYDVVHLLDHPEYAEQREALYQSMHLSSETLHKIVEDYFDYPVHKTTPGLAACPLLQCRLSEADWQDLFKVAHPRLKSELKRDAPEPEIPLEAPNFSLTVSSEADRPPSKLLRHLLILLAVGITITGLGAIALGAGALITGASFGIGLLTVPVGLGFTVLLAGVGGLLLLGLGFGIKVLYTHSKGEEDGISKVDKTEPGPTKPSSLLGQNGSPRNPLSPSPKPGLALRSSFNNKPPR